MIRRIVCFVLVLTLLSAAPVLFAQEGVQPLAELDTVTAKLAAQINQTLSGKVAVEYFIYGERDSPLGRYWSENLKAELSNISGRTYTLLNSGGQSADYVISGDITVIGTTIRIYTRLMKNSDNSISATWRSDIERTGFIDALLGSAASEDSAVRPDRYEPDSRASPVPVEIGAAPISRTLHTNDTDWFRVVSGETRYLTAETEGNTDTFMELYDGTTGPKLQEDDDGGSDTNARIRWVAEAGKEYILMVRGYSGETGPYRFKIEALVIPDAAWKPNSTRETAAPLALENFPVNALILNSTDVHWYRVELPSNGDITVYTEGDTDTVLSLVDAGGNEVAEDDDSGSGYNAQITHSVSPGILYIKVTSYDNGGPYSLHVQLRPHSL